LGKKLIPNRDVDLCLCERKLAKNGLGIVIK